MEINNKDIEAQYSEVIQLVEKLIYISEETGLVNSQEFINFLDKLNELSVSY